MDNAALYNGFGNALATAVEMVLTPAVFLLFGLWLDSRLGTTPVFAVVLAVLAFVGVIAKVYYTYRADIAREEEGKPWTR
jgi:F0F1-type ATP synthase assembly protein I